MPIHELKNILHNTLREQALLTGRIAAENLTSTEHTPDFIKNSLGRNPKSILKFQVCSTSTKPHLPSFLGALFF